MRSEQILSHFASDHYPMHFARLIAQPLYKVLSSRVVYWFIVILCDVIRFACVYFL